MWRDPVSEIDQRVEALIRARVAERFPEHDVIGEEMVERLSRPHDCVWTVDPIDGTTNFVNGFPMFAASIGVLQRGRPVVGAVWCSTGHALRPGVYHASAGGKFRFENSDVTPKLNPAVRRRLAGVPTVAVHDKNWETRKTGSAAMNARSSRPACCGWPASRVRTSGTLPAALPWSRQRAAPCANGVAANGNRCPGFAPEQPSLGGKAVLRYWRHPIVVGAPEAVEYMCAD